jgi:transcriptional antiterminator RfaH
MDNKKWFVIRTNPRAEKQVSQRLLDIGIEHYLPLYRQIRQWKDRKKYVEAPLFSSYVFVRTTEKARNEVFKVSGIVKYLFVGGQIAVVTEKEIAQIKIFCTLDEVKIEA